MVKKIALVCALLSCTTTATYAGTTGWYLGLQGGYAQTKYDGSSTLNKFFKNTTGITGATKPSNDDDGAVGRLYLGYQFNKYLAAEAGYNYFQQMDWSNLYGNNKASGDIEQQAGDLVLKPILPLSRSFQLYAIGGVAYVHASSSINTTAKNLGITDETETEFRPVYGLGAELYFQQYWSADLSWRRINGGGNVEQSDEAMIGIAYHFHNPDDDNF